MERDMGPESQIGSDIIHPFPEQNWLTHTSENYITFAWRSVKKGPVDVSFI